MSHDRNVQAFDRRAGSYDRGWLGEWHRQVAQRTAALSVGAGPAPRRVLDVGCGTATLLSELAARLPDAEKLVGVDPAPSMVAEASWALEGDHRVRVERSRAEHLPFPDGSFDLVVSTVSFDHWSDQGRGLAECARVLQAGGRLVVADLFARWLWPTTVLGRRGRARTGHQAAGLLADAGFRRVSWQRIYGFGPLSVVQAAIAVRNE